MKLPGLPWHVVFESLVVDVGPIFEREETSRQHHIPLRSADADDVAR